MLAGHTQRVFGRKEVTRVKKELLISLLAVLIALAATVAVWNRGATVAFANGAESDTAVSSIGFIANSTNPGAWIVVEDKVYLVEADYDFNAKRWTIRQLASSELTPNP